MNSLWCSWKLRIFENVRMMMALLDVQKKLENTRFNLYKFISLCKNQEMMKRKRKFLEIFGAITYQNEEN